MADNYGINWKGKDISTCLHTELCECIHALVEDLRAKDKRLAMIKSALEHGSGMDRIQRVKEGGKTLPPLATEGRGGMKP